MLDIHTHILPNVDDGSPSLSISKSLLEMEIKEGVTKVILTPHQNKNNLNKEELISKFNAFKEECKDINISLLLGAEIYYYDDFKKDLANNKILTIDNSKYILIEFSTRIETNIIDILYDISLLGYKPIIAHIERYSYLSLEDYKEIHKYALIQVNSKSFFMKDYKKNTKYLLKNNLIDFIASDCHDLEKRSVEFAKIKKLVEKKYKDQYDKLFVNDFDFNK